MRLSLDLEWEPAGNDEWYTPRYVFDGLGAEFTLDVCGPPEGVPWIPASRTIDALTDGLTEPWTGLVWMNPPYSDPAPWIRRFIQHRNGIALVPADTATRHYQDLIAAPTAVVCFLDGRVRFVRDGDSTSARFPSMIVGLGTDAYAPVVSCGLGVVMELA